MLSIGVIVDSFRKDMKEGVRLAKKVGAQGIQIYAVRGEMDPDNLNQHQRKEMLKYIKSEGLVVSALCGDLGGHGFKIQEDNPWKIEKSKRIIDLAKDLETNVVTTHIGVIPENIELDRYKIMQEACYELGTYGDSVEATFAIETGPEKAKTLKRFLDSLDTKGIGVNYDPANFVMVTGDDPVKGVETLKDYIVHTHAKDGIMVKQSDPEFIYKCFAEGLPENFRLDDYFKELALGKGAVDFVPYIDALKKIGYDGFLTIEREVGDQPYDDIKEAVKFLKRFI